MSVMMLRRGSTTLVASRRPPMPTSSTTMSGRLRAKYSKPIAVSISKKLGMPRQIAFSNQSLGGAVDYVMEQREIVVVDRRAIEANPLINANQMRRCIESCLQPGSLQDGRQRSGRRTLAVGAGDQHSWKTIFRMPQCRQQHPYVRQIELVRRRLRQLVAQRVHLRQCGFVGHRSLVSGR